MENWACIFSSSLIHQAELIKDILLNAGIEAVIINKQDSLYIIGEIEVNVAADDVINALQIIKNSEL